MVQILISGTCFCRPLKSKSSCVIYCGLGRRCKPALQLSAFAGTFAFTKTAGQDVSLGVIFMVFHAILE